MNLRVLSSLRSIRPTHKLLRPTSAIYDRRLKRYGKQSSLELFFFPFANLFAFIFPYWPICNILHVSPLSYSTSYHYNLYLTIFVYSGNALLPSMGFCDIHESSLEKRIAFHNKNRFICEISPHILYQYVFMVLWFFFISSVFISLIGLFRYIFIFVACESLPCNKVKMFA